MLRDERVAGLSDLLFGLHWQTAAWRALGVFALGYVLPRALLSAASGLSGFLQLLATVLSLIFTAGAVYHLLQSYATKAGAEALDSASQLDGDQVAAADVHGDAAPNTVARADMDTSQTSLNTAPPLALEALGQVGLERLCIALYQFNGLRSETVASGVEGEYRIRLIPRNAEKAIAILHCRAGAQQQGLEAYMALRRVMVEERLEKAFFVAPAGFVAAIAAQARSQHVTLVDLKLLHALIDRLPESARAATLGAAA